MLFAILKIIHMFGLYVGGAAGIGNGLLMAKVMKSDQPPPPYVGQVMGMIGKMGFVAIVLLWITGIGMMMLNGGIASVGLTFWVKLVGATLVLAAASMMTLIGIKAEKAGTPPDLKKIKSISRLAHVGLPLAVFFAVIAFAP